jgi:Uma2 family endonuclease
MPAVQINPPAELLAERRRLGLDLFDEMWEGVLHMVPAPGYNHQTIEGRLLAALMPIADELGLLTLCEFGLYDPEVPGHESFRVPDITIFKAEHVSERGVEGVAELAVEICSPQDESYEKMPFYERVGVAEYLIIDADERYVRRWVNGASGFVESALPASGRHRIGCVPVQVGFDGAAFVAERVLDGGAVESLVRVG